MFWEGCENHRLRVGVYQNSEDAEGTCSTDAKAERSVGVSRLAGFRGDLGSTGYQGML